MTTRIRRFVCSVLFAVFAMGLAGCHYHRGHCGGWGHYHGHFCAPIPIPRCR